MCGSINADLLKCGGELVDVRFEARTVRPEFGLWIGVSKSVPLLECVRFASGEVQTLDLQDLRLERSTRVPMGVRRHGDDGGVNLGRFLVESEEP